LDVQLGLCKVRENIVEKLAADIERAKTRRIDIGHQKIAELERKKVELEQKHVA
jgi:hypothetical protein